jgi:ribosome-binding ATPase YchF (GTP1/OBG family)
MFGRKYWDALRRIEKKVDVLVDVVSILIENEVNQMKNWADFKEDLRENKNATDAMRAALRKVVQDLAAITQASKDGEFVPVADIDALATELDKNTADIVAATLEGTPGEPTPEEVHAAGT